MPLSGLRHIAIEGPIGVGKTTLARRLGAHVGGRLLLEAPEQNPYLERFYGDPAGFALRTQMAFLLHRADQVRVLSQTDAFAGPWVSDFLFAKDAIFAGLTLDDDEYRLYRQVHDPLAEQVPQPDLVLWLKAPVPVLLQRIAQRGIPMERGISADYLERLSQAYAGYFAGFDSAPVVEVDNAVIDAGSSDADFEALLQRLSVPASRASGIRTSAGR
jgi:deoxyguanosine kinase